MGGARRHTCRLHRLERRGVVARACPQYLLWLDKWHTPIDLATAALAAMGARRSKSATTAKGRVALPWVGVWDTI